MMHILRRNIQRLVHRRLLISLPVLFVLLFSNAVPAWADIAPPRQPPGSNLEPVEATQVQMVSEVVLLEVASTAGQEQASLSNEGAYATVTATFNMRNQGSAGEQMRARFPITDVYGMGDGFGKLPEVEDFKVQVDGQPVRWERVPQQNPYDQDGEPISWAEFPVTFPAGQDVQVVVTYLLRPTGYSPLAEFSYVFFTGAGWKDSIGSADLILRLPYDASPENLILETDPEITTGPKADLQGREARFHWENFEPTELDDWHCTIVLPAAWQEVQAARAAAIAAPRDPLVFMRLGKAAKTAAWDGKRGLRRGAGVENLVAESQAAFEKVGDLKPADVESRVELADLLLMALIEGYTPQDALADQVQVEINTIRALDPKHERLPYLQNQLDWYKENLAPTPAQAEAEAPTATPAVRPAPLEPTPVPATLTPAPTVVAPERSRRTGCPAVGILVLAGLVPLLKRRIWPGG